MHDFDEDKSISGAIIVINFATCTLVALTLPYMIFVIHRFRPFITNASGEYPIAFKLIGKYPHIVIGTILLIGTINILVSFINNNFFVSLICFVVVLIMLGLTVLVIELSFYQIRML